MEFLERMLKRESCRAYNGERKVDRELLMKIVEAGRLSPSACNAQPWRFMIVDEPKALEGIRDALVLEEGKTGAPWRGDVPAFIALIEQPAKVMPLVVTHYGTTQRYAPGDLAMAAMNMCYEAMDLGLSTCIIGINDQKKMEQNLGIPKGSEVRMVLAVGYAKEESEPRRKMRKSMDEVVCFNGWN